MLFKVFVELCRWVFQECKALVAEFIENGQKHQSPLVMFMPRSLAPPSRPQLKRDSEMAHSSKSKVDASSPHYHHHQHQHHHHQHRHHQHRALSSSPSHKLLLTGQNNLTYTALTTQVDDAVIIDSIQRSYEALGSITRSDVPETMSSITTSAEGDPKEEEGSSESDPVETMEVHPVLKETTTIATTTTTTTTSAAASSRKRALDSEAAAQNGHSRTIEGHTPMNSDHQESSLEPSTDDSVSEVQEYYKGSSASLTDTIPSTVVDRSDPAFSGRRGRARFSKFWKNKKRP
ncbi:MAG: hypothetical protein J3Q66DRAFT_196694 [Benniella sp.]|nr:MAG: hypothetical protein J3Q66DRAFT_196694 [Benniella sp.]